MSALQLIRGFRRKLAFMWMRYKIKTKIFGMEMELQQSKELLRYGNAMLYLISENNMLSPSMNTKTK